MSVAAKKGSALIIALWSIIMLTMLVSSLAFNMHLEAKLTSYHRKRLKARSLAHAGFEWSKFLIQKSASGFQDEDVYGEEFRIQAINLRRGLALNGIGPIAELGEFDGSFSVDIIPEQGRRNINFLEQVDWQQMLEQAGVPQELWSELYDAFMDYTDENDLHRLNGAESDDSFYREAGYEVKNAPLDTVDELLLIKGFSEAIVFGGPDPDDEDIVYGGFARWVTTFGNGKVNINTASRGVLTTLPEIDEFAVEDLLEGRLGADGEPGTEDDGFDSVGQAIAVAGLNDAVSSRVSVDERRYLRVISVGESGGVRTGIWAIVLQDGRDLIPVFWREEEMH